MAIETEEQFRAWLETQPQEVCVAIAYRAAMRVLPLAVNLTDVEESRSLALSAFRLNQLTAVICKTGSEPFEHLVETAVAKNNRLGSDYARIAADAVGTPGSAVWATSAAGAVLEATISKNFFESAVRAISNTDYAAANPLNGKIVYAAGRAAFSIPYDETGFTHLELITNQIGFSSQWDHVREYGWSPSNALQAGGPWTFWAKWYARAMAGDPLPWDLQEKIALIPEKFWKAGPEAVAERIAEIEREYYGEPLDDETAGAEAARLVAAPGYYADIFASASVSVSYHVDLFLNKADLNCLPDGFSGFDTVSAKFLSLSDLLRDVQDKDAEIADLKAELQALNGVLNALRRELRDTRTQLLTTNHTPAEASRLRRVGQAALATIAAAAAVGGIAGGIEAGFQLNDRRLAAYEGLRAEVDDLARTMEAVEAAPPSRPDKKK